MAAYPERRLRQLSANLRPGSSAGSGGGTTVALISHLGGPHVEAYIDGLAAASSVSRVVLGDIDGSWLPKAKAVLGSKLAKVYADPLELLAIEKPLMTLVAMEAKIAPTVIRAALDAGSHVLAEKPSCTDVNDLKALIELADSKGLYVMMALSNRLLAETVKAKELVDSGAIGDLYGMELTMVADQTRLGRDGASETWSNVNERSGGGQLIWLGIHWLDLCQHITSTNIVQVAGFTSRVGEHGKKLDVEDSASATFKLDNGNLGVITSAYFTDQGYNSHMKIWGSKGWIDLNTYTPGLDPATPMKWYSHDAADPTPAEVQEFSIDTTVENGGYTPWVIQCVDACLGKCAPPISNEHSLRSVAVVHAIYESDRDGKMVAL
jgi:predicted dehydrogenase